LQLYLVRHGQSQANVDATCRVIDCNLTETGQRQAEAVAAELAYRGIDQVLSSPYVRTLHTAREIVRATGASAEVLLGLHEHHMSAFAETWPLQTRAELAFNYPEFTLPDDMEEMGWHTPPESMEVILTRMAGVLQSLRERYANIGHTRVALVSHATPIQQFIRAARPSGIPGTSSIVPAIDNASISLIDVQYDSIDIVFVNQTEHLRVPAVL